MDEASKSACLALAKAIRPPADPSRAAALHRALRLLRTAPDATLRRAAAVYRSPDSGVPRDISWDRLIARCERTGGWVGPRLRFLVVQTTYGHMERVAPNLAGSALIPRDTRVRVTQTTYDRPVRMRSDGAFNSKPTVSIRATAAIFVVKTGEATDSCECKPFHRDGRPHAP